MKNMTTNRGRFATALLALGFAAVVAFFLTACGGGGSGTIDTGPGGGGGGGGGTNYITCWNGSQAISPAACLPAPSANLTFVNGQPNAVTSTSGMSITGGSVVALGANPSTWNILSGGKLSSTSALPAEGSLNNVQVTVNSGNAPTQSFMVSFTVPCSAGTSNGSICVLHYSEFKLVVFADQGAYIGRITTGADGLPNGVVPLVNNSGFTTGTNFPLALCGVWDKLLPDGRPLVSCQTPAVGNTRRNFPVNPLTGTVEAEWTGTVPAGAVLHDVGYGTFGNTPYASHDIGLVGMYLKVNGSLVFFTNTNSKNIRVITDANTSTADWVAASAVIANGDYKYLVMFSN